MSQFGITKSEEFVMRICQRSVLTPWCYNNPRRKPGKELCDILVVCDPHIVIVSVKEVLLKDGKNQQVQYDRWEREAVDGSIKQIQGADRWLKSATRVIRRDGSPGAPLPPFANRKVHRLAVAFGSRGEVSIRSGDTGKGFVHVMTERSFQEILTELDTISDLVEYLSAKEMMHRRGCSVLIDGPESNLLGWYLFHGRTFPLGPDLIFLDDTVWQGVIEKDEFKRRKDADRESYVWDTLIESMTEMDASPFSELGPGPDDLEFALRFMARETRLARRLLGRGLREFIEQAKFKNLRSRVMASDRGVIYVLVFFKPHEMPQPRLAELGSRCFVARHVIGEGKTVIGIGISEPIPNEGSVCDLIHVDTESWSTSDDELATQVQNDHCYFAGSGARPVSEDEYPTL